MAPQLVDSSSAAPIQFTLPDAQGEEHNYEATYHLAIEGFPLAAQWMTGVLEPLASVLGIELQDFKMGDGQALDFKLDASFSAGAGAKALRELLLDPATFPMLRATLSHTRRDGVSLASDAVFNSVYRANYAEFMVAAQRVAEANGFFGPAAGLLDKARGALNLALAATTVASTESANA
tara:strand:- start:4933 stop:5469 length:537 start_codon:yes stop_codon:yes gene_type:complete